MGWSSGSELAEQIWTVVRPHVVPIDRREVAKKIFDLFEDEDCDTMCEAEQLYRDAGKHLEEEE